MQYCVKSRSAASQHFPADQQSLGSKKTCCIPLPISVGLYVNVGCVHAYLFAGLYAGIFICDCVCRYGCMHAFVHVCMVAHMYCQQLSKMPWFPWVGHLQSFSVISGVFCCWHHSCTFVGCSALSFLLMHLSQLLVILPVFIFQPSFSACSLPDIYIYMA